MPESGWTGVWPQPIVLVIAETSRSRGVTPVHRCHDLRELALGPACRRLGGVARSLQYRQLRGAPDNHCGNDDAARSS